MAKSMADYMRQYRAEGRDSSRYRPQRTNNSTGRVRHVPGHNAGRVDGDPIIRDPMIRHELRTGGLMWPNRAIGRDPAINAAEVEAALSRPRRRTPAPAPR